MSIELVIFDCDGVLVDSERIAIQVDQEVLSELGWDIEISEVIERFVGRSNRYFQTEVENHLKIKLPADWSSQLNEKYLSRFETELTPIAGVHQVLQEIPYEYCVASSGTIEKMQFTLGSTGLLPNFEGKIFSAEQVNYGKPAPDLFLLAANTFGVTPENCLVVEDSPAGLEAARNAGMKAIAFSGGLVSEDKLQAFEVPVIQQMSHLLAAIAEL